ncbi:MAG: hypothetical protein ACYC9N_22550 [Thermoanaerobaculia bacterium]
MRTLVITSVILLLGGTATVHAQTKDVQYDVSDENFYCTGESGPEVCTPTLHLNDTLRLRICGAPVDILSITQKQRELPGYAVTKDIAEKLGIVKGGAKGFGAPPPQAQPADDDTIARLFNDVRSRVDVVVADLRRTSAFVRYEGDHSSLRAAYQALLHAVPTNQMSVLTSRLQKQDVLNKIGMTTADVATYVQRLDALANASGKLECYAADTFAAEAPFDVEVEWTASNALIREERDPLSLPCVAREHDNGVRRVRPR